MPTKKQIIIIAVLGLISPCLGYWYGMPDKSLSEPEPPEIELKPPTFTSDPNNADNAKIEAAIRKAANKPTGTLTKADLEKVTRLDLTNRNLTDFSALVGLTQLKSLTLVGNGSGFTDISPLAGLTQLETLSLSNNKITDISALASLTNLSELCPNSYRITDVSPLAKLTWLKTLAIHDNRIRAKADIEKLKIALPKCSIVHGFQ